MHKALHAHEQQNSVHTYIYIYVFGCFTFFYVVIIVEIISFYHDVIMYVVNTYIYIQTYLKPS